VGWATNGRPNSSTNARRAPRPNTSLMPMSASRISPVRGSVWCGPMAKPTSAPTNQRIEPWPASMLSQSASSGCCRATMASLKPMRSKALFHSSTPAMMLGRYRGGMFLSSQNTIGLTGSDSAAAGSFFSRR
jgi:hypothetical protein